MATAIDTTTVSTRYWHPLGDGRVQCDLCPRACRLHPGQRGFCFVRAGEDGAVVLTTCGRSSGFCVDPIEKKPLYHFLPGTPVLSFGTAGCNLACRFCQNWEISRNRDMDALAVVAAPTDIADAAIALGCRSVAFTYNEPVIFLEYAVDVAEACHTRGIRTVAVTNGYIQGEARRDFFAAVDAANVDLKAFTDTFYRALCGARLRPVLDTLTWLRHDAAVWLELTTLVIPGLNDSDAELTALSRWVVAELGPDVPLHFSAFHPDGRLRDRPPTPAATLRRARAIALDQGARHVYVGNVHDPDADSTWCAGCGRLLIGRDWYDLTAWHLTDDGRCRGCGAPLAGVFAGPPGTWGSRRLPVAPGGLGGAGPAARRRP